MDDVAHLSVSMQIQRRQTRGSDGIAPQPVSGNLQQPARVQNEWGRAPCIEGPNVERI
jgi:hypothetical protein